MNNRRIALQKAEFEWFRRPERFHSETCIVSYRNEQHPTKPGLIEIIKLVRTFINVEGVVVMVAVQVWPQTEDLNPFQNIPEELGTEVLSATDGELTMNIDALYEIP